MRLIVNADDFGHDRDTSDAILEALRNGWVTQTTAMVNMPDVERAVSEARTLGFDQVIGLHLNLTDGVPLTDRIKARPLFCDADGKFNEGAVRNKRFLLSYGREDAVALACEIEAQAQKYLSLGLPLLHVDGHSHVQTQIPLARIAMPILKQMGFKTIRRPYTHCAGRGLLLAAKKLRNSLFALAARGNSLLTADEFGGDPHEGDAAGNRVVEVMVHPRYFNGEVVNTTDYDTGAGEPMQKFAERLRDGRHELVTYRVLGR